MKQLKNFLIKREQSQTRLSFAECEKSRLIAKLTLTLVALLSMTAGAWAQGSEPATDPNEVKVTPVTGKTNEWTFKMPDGNVELQVEYEPEFTATFKAGNANTIQGGKATVIVTESGATTGTQVTLDENGKLTPLYEGQTVTLTAATGYKFRKVEVKKKELPKYADVVTICEKNGDDEYLISSFFDGTNANITTITQEEAIALAEYLGGGNIRVVYEEYEFYGDKYVRATNAAGKVSSPYLSTTNTSTSPLYYVPAGN